SRRILTKLRHSGGMSTGIKPATLLPAFFLAACGSDAVSDPLENASNGDPVLARALNDPLMVDPDLAYRNEANAAITIRHDHALPPLRAGEEAGQRARDEARLELLEDGPIVDLPESGNGPGLPSLAGATTANAMLAALDADPACVTGLGEGHGWAGRMPQAASIMPHGMVRQAAGRDGQGCTVRVIRYLTAATQSDALEYHYNRAGRGGLRMTRFDQPENSIRGSRGGTQFFAHARPGPDGMTAVDLVYWQR
nr:hypothetical protein [Erythrobacter sp.]